MSPKVILYYSSYRLTVSIYSKKKANATNLFNKSSLVKLSRALHQHKTADKKLG